MDFTEFFQETGLLCAIPVGGVLVLYLGSCWNEPRGFFRLLPADDVDWSHYSLRMLTLLHWASLVLASVAKGPDILVLPTAALLYGSYWCWETSPRLAGTVAVICLLLVLSVAPVVALISVLLVLCVSVFVPWVK